MGRNAVVPLISISSDKVTAGRTGKKEHYGDNRTANNRLGNSPATPKPCERPRRRIGVPEKLVKLIFSYSFFPGFVYYSTKLYWACVSGKHVDNKTESESKILCLQRVYILMNTNFKCIPNLLNRSFIFVSK